MRNGLKLLALAALLAAPAQSGERKIVLGAFFERCDHFCRGVADGLAESGLDIKFVVREFEQDKARIPGFVAEAMEMRPDLVVTHGTSATLGVIGTLDDAGDPRYLHEIPVVFGQVADPFGTRIAESFERSGRANVAGTFNRAPKG